MKNLTTRLIDKGMPILRSREKIYLITKKTLIDIGKPESIEKILSSFKGLEVELFKIGDGDLGSDYGFTHGLKDVPAHVLEKLSIDNILQGGNGDISLLDKSPSSAEVKKGGNVWSLSEHEDLYRKYL